jgi:siderophore synthetase component
VSAAHSAAADRLAAEALLRCWIREHDLPRPAGPSLDLSLGSSTLSIPVEYWSPSGLHRFGRPGSGYGPLSPGGLARLLAETAAVPAEAVEGFVRRAAESAARIAVHLAARAAQPAARGAVTPFLTAEQALLAGDPWHPTPKSRGELSDDEAARYSPELRGAFPLHWFAVEPEFVTHESELGPSVPDLLASLSTLPRSDRILIPAHPRQAAALLHHPEFRESIAHGTLEHLGESGPLWHPTSSLRTVYSPGSPVMLKLPLALPIAGTPRHNERTALLRGVEAHRLLAGPLGAALLTAHPAFRALTDAGFAAVDGVPDLNVSLRHSPLRPTDHVFCVGALTDLGRGAIAADGRPHELATHVHSLAAVEHRPVQAVAADWFAQYVRTLIYPLLWLDAEHGVALAAHQQNTLVQLDAKGYPGTGWYRGNEGFCYRASRIGRLRDLSGLPALGAASESVVSDDEATARLLRHVGVDNLLGVVGAFGLAGLGDERALLAAAADLLAPLRGHRPVDVLLSAGTLRYPGRFPAPATEADAAAEFANPFAALGDTTP